MLDVTGLQVAPVAGGVDVRVGDAIAPGVADRVDVEVACPVTTVGVRERVAVSITGLVAVAAVMGAPSTGQLFT